MGTITLEQLLKTITTYKASDLHLVALSEPQIRVDGKLIPLDVEKLCDSDIKQLCYSVLNDKQKKTLEEEKELDFSFFIDGIGRFRANYYFEKGNNAASFRIIPQKIPTMDELNLPNILGELITKDKGLILVTGPTGSGKSTTLAAMIDKLNETTQKHILTIEDPIEFVHEHKKSLVSQRGVGEDTKSFSKALRSSLREDPDIILIGEMRDLETIRLAITATETGHLVFATLHTSSAVQTINRIINVFPSDEQALIRTQLSMSLLAVVSQSLLPKVGGGRVGVQEILINNHAIANLIREDKIHQIYSQMQLNQSQTSMQTQSQVLLDLISKNLITKDDALKVANNPEEISKNSSY
ncbi:type IV pilus twitching motility protein PilT [Arcobacter sp. FWKO B]|uniref:type IV pilus twitching motility protein PilT n=1 Tax=Arcobacter sp. FWKO B TaxID=2593672 RepID=UPI0018A43DA3|nr:type IV pilus twitching motility protein PilT [Arcobacter sp. FWKO B]QOG11619.1 type IV pilus twitching motility protein PilT [Arcobacter sp. FWKO B]